MEKDNTDQTQRRYGDKYRANVNNDKTERYRVRSLRAIIRSTEKHHGLRSETSEQASLTHSQSLLPAPLETTDVQETPLRDSSQSMSQSLTETDNSVMSLRVDLTSEQRFTAWMENFKKELHDITHQQHALYDSYVRLFIDVHPELSTISRDSTPVTTKTPTRTHRKRSHSRSSFKSVKGWSFGVWEPFYAEMSNWVSRLEKYVCREPIDGQWHLWEKARLALIHRSISDVVEALEASNRPTREDHVSLESFTGGVSYVKQGESHQINITDTYAPLPPVIIQPPSPKRIRSESITAMVRTITTDDVLLVRMPDRDDAVIKNYLLNATNRRQLIKSLGNVTCHEIRGLQDISEKISDHIFLCCHYRFENGRLIPCVDTPKDNHANNGVEMSNVQLAIVVRKGIGGTWALRNAARSLDAAHVLSLMTGKTAIHEINFDCIPADGNGTRKKAQKRSISRAQASDSVRSVSVMQPHHARHKWTSPVSASSFTDWFASVQNTAVQVMEIAYQNAGRTTTPSRRPGRSKRVSDEEKRQRHPKATAEFLQKTLKRRLPSCSESSTAVGNIRIHTLSCRLELFVEEAMWKSLDKNAQSVLNSVVMELEEWLHKKIQEWNRERMIASGYDILSVLEQRMEPREHIVSQYRSSKRSVPIYKDATPKSRPLTAMGAESCQSEEKQARCEEQGIEDFNALLRKTPGMPLDLDCLSSGVVKASIAASSLQSLSQLDIPWPFYLIGTRDCFTYDLIQVKRKITVGERNFIKTEFYFPKDEIPNDYGIQRNSGGESFPSMDDVPTIVEHPEEKEEGDWEEVKGFPSMPPKGSKAVGVTTYDSVFSHEELFRIEQSADTVHGNAQIGMYPPECYHPTIGKNGALKRTKYFFGARYLWTKEQLAERDASVAKGVRVDVPPNPIWMKELVENPLTESGVVNDGFINSWALNMYHDGSEGIQSHFDDSQRFCQPIYSLRLFSDSRLSFGTQLYGFTNGAFYIPMPRGCITIMHDKSYAANAIKHCVRPCDMTGKSAGLIMRKINEQAWSEAVQYQIAETAAWLDEFHIHETTTGYSHSRNALNGRKSLLDGSNSAFKSEHQLKAEVKSVMDSLLRNVTRNANQAELSAKRLRIAETRVSRQVMESLIKSIEGTEKQAQKERKRIEKSQQQWKRKRSETRGRKNSKTKRHSEESRLSLMNKSVIHAANKIIERVVGKQDSQMLQSASAILRQYGPTWIQEQRQEMTTISSESLSRDTTAYSERNAASVDLSVSKHTPEAVIESSGLAGDELKPKEMEKGEMNGDQQQISVEVKNEISHQREEARLVNAADAVHFSKEQSTSSGNEDEGELRKRVSGLLDTFFKNAVHFVPEWQSEQSRFGKSASPDLVEGVLKEVAEEMESVDYGTIPSSIQPRLEDGTAHREQSKRTYKLVSSDICFACEQLGRFPYSAFKEEEPEVDALWLCQGTCRRSFHFRCAQSRDGKCVNCATGHHLCYMCGEGVNELGPVYKCSLGICGKYYHVACVMSVRETNVRQGNWMPVENADGDVSTMKFKCPQHYCKKCGLSGANVFSITCIRCPTAYHARCRPDRCVQLSKKLILCPKHKRKEN